MLTLAFSAKESLFKDIYPQVGHYFDFDAAQLVSLHWPSGRLILKVTKNLSPLIRVGMLLKGHFQMWERAVFTVIVGLPQWPSEQQQ